MIRRRHCALRFRPVTEVLDGRCLLSGLTPAQITHAYGLDALTFANGTVKADGAGETIALIEAFHDPYLASDLKTFDAATSLPDPALSVVNLGTTQTNDSWASEALLDVEWAHAIAPGAKILVVEANSETVPDLLAAVNVARNTPGVAAVSMSWGFTEFASETQYDLVFATPAGHQGVSFFTASGDSGATGGAEWPSSSPNVVSVGGTTLKLGAANSIAAESVWVGGGGGYSSFEAEPSYQQSFQSSRVRTTPDVTFDADPATGAVVYSTAPSTGIGSWQTIGGTSLGTPAWAAIVTLADQGLSIAGKSSLDGATQTLPTLYALSAGHWGDFNTVTSNPTGSLSGIRPFDPFGVLRATSSASTSPITSIGLGSPNGLKIVTDLASTPLATAPTSAAPPISVSIAAPTTPTSTTPTSLMPAPTGSTKKHHAPAKKRPKVVMTHKRAVHHAVLDAALADFGSL